MGTTFVDAAKSSSSVWLLFGRDLNLAGVEVEVEVAEVKVEVEVEVEEDCGALLCGGLVKGGGKADLSFKEGIVEVDNFMPEECSWCVRFVGDSGVFTSFIWGLLCSKLRSGLKVGDRLRLVEK